MPTPAATAYNNGGMTGVGKARTSEPYLQGLQKRMAKGESLEEAAAHFDLALWRAKATFVRAGIPVPTPIRHRRPRAADERALGARIHAYLLQEDNASSTEIAAALRTTRLEVLAAVWPQDEPRLRPALKATQKFSREAIVIGLQAMSLRRGREMGARGGVAVPAVYWDAHRDPAVHPTAAVVKNRFGSWRDAGAAAGIPVHHGEKAQTGKRWNDEQLEAAVREFFAGGHGWGSLAYDSWSRGRDVPSIATVLSRLGTWPAIRARLLG